MREKVVRLHETFQGCTEQAPTGRVLCRSGAGEARQNFNLTLQGDWGTERLRQFHKRFRRILRPVVAVPNSAGGRMHHLPAGMATGEGRLQGILNQGSVDETGIRHDKPRTAIDLPDPMGIQGVDHPLKLALATQVPEDLPNHRLRRLPYP